MEKKKKEPPKPPSELERCDIAKYLETVKLRPTLLGGVDSKDVWRKLRKIDEMYSQIMDNQKIHYETLLKEKEHQLVEASRLYNKYRAQVESGEKSE